MAATKKLVATPPKKEVVPKKKTVKKQQPKKKTGPPSELEKILANLGDIAEWVKNGISNRQIAKNLGISEPTWYKHKAESSEISEAFKAAEIALEEDRGTTTESKIYERAHGF